MAEWEALAAGDFGPFQVSGMIAGWVSNPDEADGSSFVGNLIVSPGRSIEAVTRVREHYGGPLCVVERSDAPTEAQLADVQSEVSDASARRAFGEVQVASSDGRRGVVYATVWKVDRNARVYAQRRWGDVVKLVGVLTPVK
jgi:hypothetical protein